MLVVLAVLSAVPATAGERRSTLDPRPARELLYVGDSSQKAVFVYRWPGKGRAIARISNLGEPSSITLDRQNNLYVANVPGHDVAIYPPGGQVPMQTVSRGLYNPAGVAVASDGTLYVSDSDGWFNIYAATTYRLKRTVWLPNAGQMAFDNRGYFYVVYQNAGGFEAIMRYPPHSLKGTPLPIGLSSAMAVDPASANIAAPFNCCTTFVGIALYAPPSYGDAADCMGGSTYSGEFASHIAFDPLGPYLFATLPSTSGQAAQVAVYAYQLGGGANSCTFLSGIESEIQNPTGITVGPDVGQWGKSD